MPELPEVETIIQGLRREVVFKQITECVVSDKKFRNKPIVLNEKILINAVIKDVKRRSKYILIYLDNYHVLIIHLGMSGRICINHASKHKVHDHLEIKFSDGAKMIFNDPRRFGIIKLVLESELSQEPLLKKLGVEPLEAEFNFNYLKGVCGNRKTSIKTVIMDGNLLVGVGNIYASESLFKSGIMPNRSASSLSIAEIKKLVAAIKSVLKTAIKAGGSTLKDYAKHDGTIGDFQNNFDVYARAGQPCKVCKTAIEKMTISGRSTYYCTKCQK